MQVKCKVKESRQRSVCCSDGVQSSAVSAILAFQLQVQMQLQMWSVTHPVQRLVACSNNYVADVASQYTSEFGHHGAACKAFCVTQSKGSAAYSSLLLRRRQCCKHTHARLSL